MISNMVNLPRLSPHRKLPLLPAVSSASVSTFSCSTWVSSRSKALNKCDIGIRAPRRLVLGVGAACWTQFLSMAGSVASKSFIASARQKGAVEEVKFSSLTAVINNNSFVCYWIVILWVGVLLMKYDGMDLEFN